MQTRLKSTAAQLVSGEDPFSPQERAGARCRGAAPFLREKTTRQLVETNSNLLNHHTNCRNYESYYGNEMWQEGSLTRRAFVLTRHHAMPEGDLYFFWYNWMGLRYFYLMVFDKFLIVVRCVWKTFFLYATDINLTLDLRKPFHQSIIFIQYGAGGSCLRLRSLKDYCSIKVLCRAVRLIM